MELASPQVTLPAAQCPFGPSSTTNMPFSLIMTRRNKSSKVV